MASNKTKNKLPEDQGKEIGYVKPREITTEMQECYLDYAMSVIVSRALPDVRDGLKPVHRRILYAMYEDGLRHTAKFRKSATVVGSTLGRYHPHGDMAVYDALVRMAQDFSLRYPLIKSQGNFGSIDGDGPAAPRYTECRLSAIGEEMLRDIEKDTVDFQPNYDSTRKEPVVLPSPMPQLLLNGSLGIAVGMATNIPPHNLEETLQAVIYLIDHQGVTTEEIFNLNLMQGPDFPTGGIIYGKKDIISAYSQGKGPILMRGRAKIEETQKKNSRIIITEIPYQVQKSSLVQQIAKLVEEKRVEGIRNIRDESDRTGMRIVIDLKKEAFPKKVLNALYKYTDLQKIFYLNMLALTEGLQPKVLSLVDVLNLYLSHKKEVVLRRTRFELEKARQRGHILEGLMIALKNIDEVIKTIKKSENRNAAQNNLQKKFKLTEIQANAILEMKLQSLAKLEREKIEKELAEIRAKIRELNLILKNPHKVKEVMKKELEEMRNKYGDKRRTKVVSAKPGEIAEEDLIPKEETTITLTKGGFIKRLKPSTYKVQQRGGKGVIGIEITSDDYVDKFVVAHTLNKLLFFTDSGKVFQCFVWEIPEMGRVSRGRGLLNFLEISPHEKVLDIIPYSKDEKEIAGKYLVIVTKNGIIKKTDLASFKNVRRTGLIAIKLQKGDLLCSVRIIKKDDEVILITKKGKAIRFPGKDIRAMGRGAAGVKGIKLTKGDEVIAMDVIKRSSDTSSRVSGQKKYLLVVTENGYGKRTKVQAYRLQGRGGSGIKTANINPKTGNIVFSKIIVDEDKDLVVISQKGQVIRTPLKSISIIGRAASGVRVMKLRKGDKVASAICL